MGGVRSLLKSRKFWTAVAAIMVLVAVNVFNWRPETAEALAENVVSIAVILIGAIAIEDAAEKFSGNGKGQW
ncbi:MAG: hypothetical protein ACYTAN_17280 [Planctomycetota bacterium]|jgi:hypothetical protein